MAKRQKRQTIITRLKSKGWIVLGDRLKHPSKNVEVESFGSSDWIIYRNGMKIKEGTQWSRLIIALSKLRVRIESESSFNTAVNYIIDGYAVQSTITNLLVERANDSRPRMMALSMFSTIVDGIKREGLHGPNDNGNFFFRATKYIKIHMKGQKEGESAKLLVIFVPSKKGGAASLKDNKTIMIAFPKRLVGFLGGIKDREFIHWINNRDVQSTFVHEFIHYLDRMRIDPDIWDKLQAEANPDNGLHSYFNSPLEMNAHFQATASRFEDRILGDLGHADSMSEFNKLLSDNIGTNPREFMNKFVKDISEYDMWRHLSHKNKKKVVSRIYTTWTHLTKLAKELAREEFKDE